MREMGALGWGKPETQKREKKLPKEERDSTNCKAKRRCESEREMGFVTRRFDVFVYNHISIL